MKRLYVVYGLDDRPFVECEKLRDAYSQARECFDNHGGHISIDVFFWQGYKGYSRECAYGDFYFIDRKGDAILPEDLGIMGISWYNLFYCNTKEDLEKIRTLCEHCEMQLNDIYSIKNRNDYKKKRNSISNT